MPHQKNTRELTHRQDLTSNQSKWRKHNRIQHGTQTVTVMLIWDALKSDIKCQKPSDYNNTTTLRTMLDTQNLKILISKQIWKSQQNTHLVHTKEFK